MTKDKVCRHLWECPESEGSMVIGVCRYCRDWREFDNRPVVLDQNAPFEIDEDWDGNWDNAVKAIEESR